MTLRNTVIRAFRTIPIPFIKLGQEIKSGIEVISQPIHRAWVSTEGFRTSVNQVTAPYTLPFRKAFAWYTKGCEERPKTFQMTTTIVTYAIGDIIAQKLGDEPFDWQRFCKFVLFSAAVAAPSYYIWYRYIDRLPYKLARAKMFAWSLGQRNEARAMAYLIKQGYTVVPPEKLIPNFALDKFWYYASKILADQLVFSSIYLSTLLISMGGTEQWKKKFLSTYTADCAVWGPIQVLNYLVVPPSLRGPLVQFVNIFWNAFLSMQGSGH